MGHLKMKGLIALLWAGTLSVGCSNTANKPGPLETGGAGGAGHTGGASGGGGRLGTGGAVGTGGGGLGSGGVAIGSGGTGVAGNTQGGQGGGTKADAASDGIGPASDGSGPARDGTADSGDVAGIADLATGRGQDAPVAETTPRDAGPGGDAATGEVVVTFHNGVFWNDTKGKRIEAHGGGFIKVADTWYWIGEDKSQNSATFKAVNCYASKDLVTWEFRNAIITRSTTTQLNTADRIIERPKVIYNDTTKQYVMWLHWENGNYSEASAGVFTSPTIDGNYTFVKSFQPNGNMSRDCNLFKDDDGKAYFMSSANNNQDMMVYLLTDDYLDMKQQVIKLFAGSQREAPAMFKVGGTYFLITSAATSWDPNQAKYATASAIAGPWTALTNLGDSTTFDTQPTYVIPVVGSEVTTYIYAGDRWQDPDLVSSKYIWLPLVVKGTSLGMNDYDQWQLNLTTGRWSGGNTNSNYVAQDNWKLIKVDSEETSAENDPGINAFDGISSTFWHSKYTGGAAPLPHEIQIDLGAIYNLTGMSYLPRQDGNPNGTVGQYGSMPAPTRPTGAPPSRRGRSRATPPRRSCRSAARLPATSASGHCPRSRARPTPPWLN